MITLCINYTLAANKLADSEAHTRSLMHPVERCGGKFVGCSLPTKAAGPTNTAPGLIDLPGLAANERYRETLRPGADAVESLRRAEAAGCIRRSFVRRVS